MTQTRRARWTAAATLALSAGLFSAPYLLSETVAAKGDFLLYYRAHALWAREAWTQDCALLFWSPYSFAGTPYLGDGQGADPYFCPLNWPWLATAPEHAVELVLTLQLALALGGMYRLARFLRTSRTAAVLAALSYGLSTVTVARLSMSHTGPYATFACAPLVILLLLRLLDRASPGRFAAFAGSVYLALTSGQPQYIYHLVLLCAAILIWKCWGDARWIRKASTAVGAAAVGVLLAAPVVLVTIETSLYTARTPGVSPYGDSAIPRHHAWVAENFLYYLVPDFPWSEKAQGLVARDYWYEKQAYAGLIPLFLAGLALVRKVPGSRALGLIALFAVLDAMARDLPFHSILNAVLPSYGSFRVPARIIWITLFCLSLLGAFGWDELQRHKAFPRLLVAPLAAGVLLVAAVLILILKAPREAILWAAHAGASIAILWIRPFPWKPAVTVILLVLPLLGYGWGRQVRTPLEVAHASPWYAAFIQGDRSAYRILVLAGDGNHPDLRGLRGYGHPIPAALGKLYRQAWQTPEAAFNTLPAGFGLYRPEILDLLNVRWIVERTRLDPRWEERARKDDLVLYENPGARPVAFLLDGGPATTTRSTNRLRVECRSSQGTRLVVSESWMPGWSARVNDRPVQVRPFEEALLQIDVPAGESVVELRYRPVTFSWGLAISILAVLGLIGASVVPLVRRGP
jgi:hypothetical protein